MVGTVAERVRELIRDICKEHDVEIIKGHVSRDQAHLLVSVPPHLAISRLVQYLKGKSSYKMLMKNKQLSKEFWGPSLGKRILYCYIGERDGLNHNPIY